MHPHLWLILLMTALFNALFQVECRSYFGIGNRVWGDQLLQSDEIQNRHTGLTEVPKIAFNYAIRDPVTYIEIMSDQNVFADVNFSYYDALINGTVTALSTSIKDENEPFKVLINIYGFNETTPESCTAKLLRQTFYYGSLVPELEPGEIDHMENTDSKANAEVEILGGEEIISTDEQDNIEKVNIYEDFASESEELEDEVETFESMDKFITVGVRQKGDYLLFETFQTSPTTTKLPTNHTVIFYFIDDVYITYIEFVLIDYCHNKTTDEIKDSHLIEYSQYSPNTFKAIVKDYKTTSLFVKMSVYGYKPEDLPENYISYVPQKIRSYTATESPEMHLRSQINAMQRESTAKLPSNFDMLRNGGEIQYRITDDKTPHNNANTLQSKIINLSVILPLGFIIVVYNLWSTVVLFD